MESGTRTFYLGRYNCVEQLGSGPLGDTYRAKIYGVAGFEKQFAVKRLHSALTGDEAFVARFMPAASAFAALEHQRIARVHEVNAQGAHYYIVIDLIRGLDLRRILDILRQRGEALAPDVATLIAIEIAEGLEYAHSRTNVLPGGVLHLGLTAQSVMVTYEGEIKLVDVGLLAALVQPGWSQHDDLVATLAYLAPEQLRAEPLDARADLFSLGAVLHELLSGSRLFLSDRAADLRAAIEGGPPPPPAADPRLQQIISCALNPDRDMRFRGAAEMRAALQALLGGRADRARGELSSLVRRLAAPRERRTGAFAAVTLPPSVLETVTPVSQAKPPPIPSHVWAPPAPKPPIGPMLSTVRTHNTLAGLGPDDAVLTPIELIELPGLPTEKGMTVVTADEPNGASARAAESPANGRAEVQADAPATANGTAARAEGNGGVGAPGTSNPEPSWSPPVVPAPPPSPVPVFAEPRKEQHAPVEPPSSPVPGVSLPPRQPGNRSALVLVGLLTLAGGLAIYFGMGGGDAARPSAYAPSSPPLTANVPGTKTNTPSETEAPPTETPRKAEPPTPVAAAPTAAVKPATAMPVAPAPTTSATPSPTTATASPSMSPTTPSHATTTSPSTTTPATTTSAPSPSPSTTKRAEGAVATGEGIDIQTTPAGASIYVDGEPQGVTPTRVKVAPGKHHVVLAAEHYKLVKQDVTLSASRPLQVTLEEVTLPPEVAGPAGLKVRCKTLHELRVFVDGADSGVACPNDERISVKAGPHTIGLYSPRTDETHEVEHDVVDGNNSTRVYTKY